MDILGFKNRTENWKTAREFLPFFKNGDAKVSLVQRLVGRRYDVSSKQINLELFWFGVRDYIDYKVQLCHDSNEQTKVRESLKCKILAASNEVLPDVKNAIENFNSKLLHKSKSYNPGPEDQDSLFNNLFHTEIDIVVETPDHLCIGEAKWETNEFGSYGEAVLVHQLIRQYVMAEVLLKAIGRNLCVVPFVVLKNKDNRRRQLRFMKANYMCECNVLDWECIRVLSSLRAQ